MLGFRVLARRNEGGRLPALLAGRRFRAWFRFDGERMLSRKVVLA